MEIIKKLNSQLCRFCGKVYESFHPLQRYCSPSCRISYNRVEVRKKHPLPERKTFSRKCSLCGIDFIAKEHRQKFCSKKCRNTVKNKKKALRQKNSSSRLVRKIGKCEVCGLSIREALEAHHYTPTDRIVLCGSCHNIWHKLSKTNHSLRDMVISTVSNHLLDSQIQRSIAPNLNHSVKPEVLTTDGL